MELDKLSAVEIESRDGPNDRDSKFKIREIAMVRFRSVSKPAVEVHHDRSSGPTPKVDAPPSRRSSVGSDFFSSIRDPSAAKNQVRKSDFKSTFRNNCLDPIEQDR